VSSVVLFSVYYLYNAYDVGLTEISIGAFLSFFYFYTAYAKVGQRYTSVSYASVFQIVFAVFCACVLFSILIYTGYLLEEISSERAQYSKQYLEVYQETHISNVITAILASFRAFDTMGETLIIAFSSIGIAGILNNSTKCDNLEQKI
jgi:multicomponent Na+:H+ antiporter subunit B